MSNDGIPGRVANQQQQQGTGTSSNYEAHPMSYFDQDPNNASAAAAQSSHLNSNSLQQQQSAAEGSPVATANTSASAATNSGGSVASTSASASTSLGITADQQQQQPQGSTSASSPHTENTNANSIVVPIPHRAQQQQQVGEPKSSSSGGPAASSSSSNSYQSAIKLMVSNNVAGSIIGRAGQTISDLQTQSSARIKLSQTGDYYPGTQDRVCLVQGQLGTVKHAVKLLLERFYMLQEQQHTQHSSWQPRAQSNKNANAGNSSTNANTANAPTSSGTTTGAAGFDFVVRLLVPSSSCGMIIGKGGVNIKHMEESSGVTSVRLSPKESSEQTSHAHSHAHAHSHPSAAAVGSGTLERVVTLTGPTLESCLSCISIVIDCMSANHEICRYTNMTTSYSRHVVAPGSYAPVQTGQRSLLHHSQHTQHSHSSVVPQHTPGTGEWDVSNQGAAAAGVYGAPFMIKRSTSQPDLSHMSMDQVGLLRAQSRMSQESFVGSAVSVSQQQQQIGQQREGSTVQQQFNSSFMDLPQAYNNSERGQQQQPTMLGGAQDQNRGQQRSNNNNPTSNIAPMYLLGSPASTHSQLDQHPSMQSSTSAPDLLALQFQDSLRISNSQQAGQGGGQGQAATDYSHFAAQLPQPTQPGFTAQVLVPDNLIGSILGRGGSTLNDLQMHSNTRIRISQRGEYVPGTRNRIVTIRGQTAHGVNYAQYLMNERMALPPTAGFTNTGQPPPAHPHLTAAAPPYAIHQHPTAQLQQPYPQQRMPFHQSTQTAVPVDSHSSSSAAQQQQQQQALSAAVVTPPLTLSLNTSSDNDLALHR
uniref:K Homology domain-containing protein n=2 Tax=Pseudo-nitzschia australis TaxID=44445 RepID=A0A7S4ALC8_9STRA